MNDQQLIDLLNSPIQRVRSAALELLSASYCNAPTMVGAILQGWDRYGVAEAFPEFMQISHLPAHHQYMEVVLEKAAVMAEGRKLVDPVCRCAGKIIEAMVLLPPEQIAEFIPRIAELKKLSKIFFRIEMDELQRRVSLAEKNDNELIDLIERSWKHNAEGPIAVDAVYALEVLHRRGSAEDIVRRSLSPLESWEQDNTRRLSVVLQVASRQAFLGFEDLLVPHVNHVQAPLAATACIALARCRSRDAVYAIVEKFPTENPTTQLRMADVLGRLHVPGASVRIHELREASQDPKVCDALNLAEVLHFDFGQIDNWMEALFVLSDRTLNRYRHVIELAEPLAKVHPENIRRHIAEALRIRS